MAIKARGEFTISVVNDGRGEKTYIRYSDDNGQTFTKDVPLKTTGDMFAGRNIFAINAGLLAEAGAVLDKSIRGVKCTKTRSLNRVGQLFRRFANNLPQGQFRISGRMKTEGTMFSVNINMGGVNAGDVTATPNWQPFSLLVNNPGYSDAPNYCFVDFRYGMTQPTATTLNLYIADLMITQGNTPYDYAPAPEDQQFGLTQGKYIGIMSWDKPYPPLDPSAYKWSAFQGQDAELYKLSPLEESAIVGNDGACKVTLRYNVTYIAGSKASKYTGDDITIKADSRLGALNFTKKATGEWECVTTIADFITKNLGSFNVSVMKGAQVLDTRVIPVTYATQALLDANQKLGEVVASVKGVSKLIHNLFVGSTFLEPIDGVWSMAGAKVDDALKYNNSNVVFIEEHGAAQDTYHSLLFNVSGLAPNTAYTISAMVRTDNLASFTGGNNGAVLEVTQTTNGQRKRLFDPISIVPLTANAWEKVEHTFTTPPTLTSEVVEVKFMLLRNGRLWLSQPMMNQGNVAADYTANIKDIQLSLAQIKLTANTISQTVTDLSTGIEQAGIHLDGANSEITLKADKTKFVDRDGETDVFIKDGKLNAKAINADKVIADGIQGKTIDAKDATFDNVNIGGKTTMKGVLQQATAFNGDYTAANVFFLPAITTDKEIILTQELSDIGKVIKFYNSSDFGGGRYLIRMSQFAVGVGLHVSTGRYIAIVDPQESIEITCFSSGDNQGEWTVTGRFGVDQFKKGGAKGRFPRVLAMGTVNIKDKGNTMDLLTTTYNDIISNGMTLLEKLSNNSFKVKLNTKFIKSGYRVMLSCRGGYFDTSNGSCYIPTATLSESGDDYFIVVTDAQMNMYTTDMDGITHMYPKGTLPSWSVDFIIFAPEWSFNSGESIRGGIEYGGDAGN